jgi:flagellar basal-body rod modification protein FlgD
MATVSGVSGASFDYTGGASGRNTGELGKDEFLKLLTMQLKYQDPMSPDSSTEFIAQLAQFSSLEGMTNLQDSFAGVQAYTLLGKVVSKVDGITQEETLGEVVGVKFVDGDYQLSLNTLDKGIVDIQLSEVKEVIQPVTS